jgi:hypothetical protein
VSTRWQAAPAHDRACDELAQTAPAQAARSAEATGEVTLVGGAIESGPTLRDPGEPKADLSPGDRAGDYIVREPLARGGFGAVYRAEHAVTGEARALKVLHAELATTAQAVLRFEREVEAIQRVPHPNVIAIESVGRLPDGRPYFVMELLRGVDLSAHLAAVGRLSPIEARAILEPLASALDAVHARGIIHRDLKPSNVFLDERGPSRRVVLLDFGVVKLLDERGPGLTASFQMVGTPAFMTPEQIRGLPADVQTDVYALGTLLYCMLTGKPPFTASQDVVLSQLQLHVRPPRPSSRAPVDPALDDVVLRAMSKDPARRHASAGALLDDFRKAIGAVAPPAERRTAAVYVGVRGDEAALDEADEGFLADLDAALPRAAALLGARGLRQALDLGNGALFLMDLPEEALAEQRARRDLIDISLGVFRELEGRPGRDARVSVTLCLHAGSVVEGAERAPEGALIDLATWVPEPPTPGVLATDAMLDGLGQAAEARSGGVARLC